ncbi:MAG TPA: HEPN domain-containing protein [bacterium]|nr:HEPN domain-containing protein [bacterium]
MTVSKAAELMLGKAAQDEFVFDQLRINEETPQEALGFHAQQAVEKLLKALLAAAGIEYPLTHQLAELMDLVRDSEIDLPEDFEELRYLTPFAIEFRYDIYPQESEARVDWDRVRQEIRRLRSWIETWIQKR